MNKEEIIKYLKTIKPKNFNNYKDETPCSLITKKQIKAIQGLLDLYNKQKEKIQSLENQLDFIGEQNKYIEKLEKNFHRQQKEIEDLKDVQQQICNEELLKKEHVQNNYIRKDKVLKALGYRKENSEAYKKLKQDEEKMVAVLDTIYSEFCRLEDIEDQKVEVAIAFIEEKRDKYWQDKINNKIKKLEKQEEWYRENSSVFELEDRIKELKELLEE